MKIRELFQRDIQRKINSIIKVEQASEELIIQELEEYVVTEELHGHFKTFFNKYLQGIEQQTDNIGVLVNGFFGSGRSQFLNMLSYLLSDKQYQGRKGIDFFAEKTDDLELLSDIRKAAKISTDVVLFHIDGVTDLKSGKDFIVNSFMNAFNKMQGFSVDMPWVANLERTLVRDGVYETFCIRFHELAGIDWEQGREDYYFEEDNLIQALVEATGGSLASAKKWYDTAERNYLINAKIFAEQVKIYIANKEKKLNQKHQMIFLCDGMNLHRDFDGDSLRELQEIITALGRECQGQAWVVVTGLKDSEKKIKTNNPESLKIDTLFGTKIVLSSSCLDEVIKRRLLIKTGEAKDILGVLFANKKSAIEKLLVFSPSITGKMGYTSKQEFIDTYPMVPYHFHLLQAVFNEWRSYGEAGKAVSAAERSFLTVFQDAIIRCSDNNVGALVPLYTFYQVMEPFLADTFQKVISDTENNIKQSNTILVPFDIEVLKILVMLKLIPKLIRSNKENITTLMVSNINQDRVLLMTDVEKSLNRLEKQDLILKGDDNFIFLSTREQQIHYEIKNTRIEVNEVQTWLGRGIIELFFAGEKMFTYDEHYGFPFNVIIDDLPIGLQQEELGVRILTPYSPERNSEVSLKALSIREPNLIVALSENMIYLQELEQAMQINRYFSRRAEPFNDIVLAMTMLTMPKRLRHMEKYQEQLEKALEKAEFFVNGRRLSISSGLPEKRIGAAFKELINYLYPKRGYILDFYSEEMERAIFAGESSVLNGIESGVTNPEATAEILSIIKMNERKKILITMGNINHQFSRIPYGWRPVEIVGIILQLFFKKAIVLELDGEKISFGDEQLVKYLTNKNFIDRIVINASLTSDIVN